MNETHVLFDILVFLIAAICAVPLFQRFKLGAVLAYLVAGIVIGPSAMGLVADSAGMHAAAEFGVVFLLFAIGLELKPERLRLFGRRAFALAILQFFVTGGAGVLVASGLGFDTDAAVVLGGAIALSSTAVVLALLSELQLSSGRLGRDAIAVLLVQDLMVPPLLIVVQAFGGGGEVGTALALAALKSMGIGIVLVLVARFLLRPFFRLASSAGASEMFTAAVLLIVLGTGWATEQAGLSMALGAFLAGMMTADTGFQHQVAADIQPFRGLLLGLFFMTVGMGIDVRTVIADPAPVAGLVALIVAGKTAIMVVLALMFGYPLARGAQLAALLAQGSEFAFVLLALAAASGVVPPATAQVLGSAVAVSLLLTPVGAALARAISKRGRSAHSSLGDLGPENAERSGHVIVVSFGQIGKAVTRYLRSLGIPVVVLDLNAKRVMDARVRGLPVFFGDATRPEVLRAAGLERAQAICVAPPDFEAAEDIVRIIRSLSSDVRVVVRVSDDTVIDHARRFGADAVVVEGLTTAAELVERTLLFVDPVLYAEDRPSTVAEALS